MAKVKITGHASGSGVFTITAPNSNTDRTITLPDASVTLGTDATKLPLAGGTVTGDVLINNGSSAQLGIGVSPSHMLHVVAPASIGDYAVKIDTPDRYGLRIEADGAAAATPLVILDGSTEIFTVKGDGRGLSQFTAKAWCKFTGVSTTAILDSHNVSSITDIGTGATRVLWDVDMANANYAAATNSPKPGGNASAANSNHTNAGEHETYRILYETNQADGHTKKDLPENSIVIFGD